MGDERPTIDPVKAVQNLAAAQDTVAAALKAVQATCKFWEMAQGPSDTKRSAWKAFIAASDGFDSAVAEQTNHLTLVKELQRQGDLFNADGTPTDDAVGGVQTGPAPGGPKPPRSPKPGMGIVKRGPQPEAH